MGRRRIAISNPSGADAVGQYSISCSVIFSLIEPVAYGQTPWTKLKTARSRNARIVASSRVSYVPKAAASNARTGIGKNAAGPAARIRRASAVVSTPRTRAACSSFAEASTTPSRCRHSWSDPPRTNGPWPLTSVAGDSGEIARDARLHLLRTNRLAVRAGRHAAEDPRPRAVDGHEGELLGALHVTLVEEEVLDLLRVEGHRDGREIVRVDRRLDARDREDLAVDGRLGRRPPVAPTDAREAYGDDVARDERADLRARRGDVEDVAVERVAQGEVPAVGVVAECEHDRAARVAHEREDLRRRRLRLVAHDVRSIPACLAEAGEGGPPAIRSNSAAPRIASSPSSWMVAARGTPRSSQPSDS